MDKELIDRAWACLPREFKQEVKNQYRDGFNDDRKAIGILFGIDNLLSDTEGEEMLTVSRKRVQEFYSKCKEVTMNPKSYPDYAHESALSRMALLDILFGSKCLPDEGTDCTPVEVGVAENTTTSNVGSLEPKPAEPKFKIGDELVWDKRILVKIDEVLADGKYLVFSRIGNRYMVKESDLEPYTEPTDLNKSSETCTDNCSSQNHFVVKDEMVDNIIKDGFAKERRLNIAAQMAQSILRNNDEIYRASVESKAKTTPAAIAEYAFALADALLAECEKKGGQDA